jgi:hypothetical protein
MNKGSILGFVIGEFASVKNAEEYAERMKRCPYLLLQACEGARVYSAYVVQKDQRWWLEFPNKHPKAAGFEHANVHIGEKITSVEEFRLRLPRIKGTIAPCGADCRSCSIKDKHPCCCCPATLYFRKKM